MYESDNTSRVEWAVMHLYTIAPQSYCLAYHIIVIQCNVVYSSFTHSDSSIDHSIVTILGLS